MALVSMRQLLDHAAENGYGVPAFNVNNIEQVHAIMTAAAEVGAPVIMQASAGARKYAGEAFLKHMIEAAVEEWPDVPVCMHQDHGQSPAVCQIAMRMGFTSVMMDGSLMSDGKTIASYDYNVEVTKRVVENAHCIGVSVEGELGCLGSLETMKGDKEDGHGTDATYANVIAHATWRKGIPPPSLPSGAISIWLGRSFLENPSFSPEQIDLGEYPFARMPDCERPCFRYLQNNIYNRRLSFLNHFLDPHKKCPEHLTIWLHLLPVHKKPFLK